MAISEFIRFSKTDRPEKKKKVSRNLIIRRRIKGTSVSVIESSSPLADSVKKGMITKNISVDPPFSDSFHIPRLTDPSIAVEVRRLSDRLESDPDFALKLLRKAGIANASGKLSKRYGG